MKKLFLWLVVIWLIWSVITFPYHFIGKLLYGDKIKVSVMLTSGKKITGYTFKESYYSYLRDKPLKLTNRTIPNNQIEYAVQIYNPFGSLEENIP